VRKRVILDAGPLVALIARDEDHNWAVAQWGDVEPPLLTWQARDSSNRPNDMNTAFHRLERDRSASLYDHRPRTGVPFTNSRG